MLGFRRHQMAAKKTKTKRARKPAAKKAGKVAKKRGAKKGGRQKAGKRRRKPAKSAPSGGGAPASILESGDHPGGQAALAANPGCRSFVRVVTRSADRVTEIEAQRGRRSATIERHALEGVA